MSVVSFIKGSIEELRQNVTWTKYSELQSNSFLVIVASIVFAIVIGIINFGFDFVLKWFYQAF
ncbi:MAG: preprotein translocase subunit SecE [Bacteroidetes bacterium]|jgi:preprotein translocase subunit SecE|nr:MAG: preprotein translocase subunit SecE [Bacteroidota bacterium]